MRSRIIDRARTEHRECGRQIEGSAWKFHVISPLGDDVGAFSDFYEHYE
jgi:hypothetical protein